MLFCPDIFSYVAILLVAFLSMLMIGAVCMRLLPELYSEKNCLANVFVCLMSGFVTLVTLSALIIARCNSVQLLSVVIIMYYVLFVREKHRDNGRFRIDACFVKHSLVIAVLLLLSYFAYYYIYFIRANGEIWCDYTFYSNVSCHMAENHCENADLFSDMRFASKYHWGDLWLTSLFGTLFGANYLYVLVLVTYPVFSMMCVVGGCSVIYHLTGKKVASVFSGVGLLFAIPLVTVVIHWSSPVAIGSKLIVVYCFAVLSLLFHYLGRPNLSYVALLLLTPFFSTVAPGVLTMVCVLSVIEKHRDGVKNLPCVFNRIVLLSVLVAVSYVVFYLLQEGGGRHAGLLYDDSLSDFVGFAIKRSGRVVLFIPCVTGLWLMSKKNKTDGTVWAMDWIVSVVSGVIVSSLVGGCVRQVMLDGGQITTNFSEPMFNITCWLLAVLLLACFPGRMRLDACTLLLVLFYVASYCLSGNKYGIVAGDRVISDEEIKNIEALRAEVNNGKYAMGYYRNYEIEENFNTHKSRLRMFFPMDKMPHLVDNGYYAPYCLSALDIPDDLKPMWNERNKSELFIYTERLKKNGLYTNDTEAILSFMKDYGIRYVVVEKGCELPHYLEGDAVVVYDGDDKVYRLNYNWL